MTNDMVKILLMITLLGGLRVAIFINEMSKSQVRMLYRTLLH